MRIPFLVSVLGTLTVVPAVAIVPNQVDGEPSLSSACGCTTTITRYAQELDRRQGTCPPPVTITTTVAPPVITLALSDPVMISSQFMSDSQVHSLEWNEHSQDAPISQPYSNTLVFTDVASGPAVYGTEWPDHGTSILYHYTGATTMPIATRTMSIGPSSTPSRSTITIYSTTYVPVRVKTTEELGVSSSGQVFEKRQTSTPQMSIPQVSSPSATCTMIFAQISGSWASWCNNWNGVSAVSLPTSFATTILATSGISVPASVLPASKSVVSPYLLPPSLEPVTTSIAITVSFTVTEPITTMTSTHGAMSPSATMDPPHANNSMTTPSSVSVGTSSSATSSGGFATSCGQIGHFMVNFDDLPVFSTNSPDNPETPPVPTPYDHFAWSDGFGYGPPGPQAYLPHDGTRLGQFDPRDAHILDPPAFGSMPAGSFGAGARAFNSIYYFDAHSAWMGCNNTASNSRCDFVVTAYQWRPDNASLPTIGREHVIYTQHFSPPTCPTKTNCTLTPIYFDAAQFSGLSSVNFYANVGGTVSAFFIDAIDLSWSNNSCAAGLARISSRR